MKNCLRLLAAVTAALSILAIAGPLQANDAPLPPNLIALTSPPGTELLAKADVRQPFLALMSNYVTQKYQVFCGVASSVMVLNAMGIPAPIDVDYAPHPYFTQDNFFNARTEAVLPKAKILHNGMTLDQLAGLLQVQGVAATAIHAGDSTVAGFRDLAVQTLAQPNSYVVINYNGSTLGQTEHHGHISPLAAYDAASDRFLLLDVSRYMYPPFWGTAADLFSAMNTADPGNNNLSRGFVLVRPLDAATAAVGGSAAIPTVPRSGQIGTRIEPTPALNLVLSRQGGRLEVSVNAGAAVAQGVGIKPGARADLVLTAPDGSPYLGDVQVSLKPDGTAVIDIPGDQNTSAYVPPQPTRP